MKDRETLIGSSPRSARKQGIQMRPRATGAQGSTVTFADGSELAVDAVVWATGFRLDHSFVELPVFDDRGQVKHERGVTDVPGLYFLGLPWQHTRGSALLGWVKDDAEFIALFTPPPIALAVARPTSQLPRAAWPSGALPRAIEHVTSLTPAIRRQPVRHREQAAGRGRPYQVHGLLGVRAAAVGHNDDQARPRATWYPPSAWSSLSSASAAGRAGHPRRSCSPTSPASPR